MPRYSPSPFLTPAGQPAMAMLHRPAFSRHPPGGNRLPPKSRDVDLDRESIWISYCPLGEVGDAPYYLSHFTLHGRLASPMAPWERLKIGGGTPPILTRHGWLIIYHGVSEMAKPTTDEHRLCYSAGVMMAPRGRIRT